MRIIIKSTKNKKDKNHKKIQRVETQGSNILSSASQEQQTIKMETTKSNINARKRLTIQEKRTRR